MDCSLPGSSVHRIFQASGLHGNPLQGMELESSCIAGGFFIISLLDIIFVLGFVLGTGDIEINWCPELMKFIDQGRIGL